DYTLALDIAGHEFTHAIVSNTANFAGPGEPGALNEAFADIFGILISRWKDPTQTWSIGAKLYHNTDGDSDEIALRSLSNPEKFKTSTTIDGKSVDVGFPDRYSKALALKETCNDDNDQCEVHANSTIWSHSAYLFNQKLQNQLNYKSTDADKLTGDLYFITLTHKLHETETMHSAGTALLQTCNELYENKVCDLVTASLREIEVLP
ncbi:MAG: M4 family metallopeptidase, partial [Pseudobdellovibrio sp.]